jgi:hypothetical protein
VAEWLKASDSKLLQAVFPRFPNMDRIGQAEKTIAIIDLLFRTIGQAWTNLGAVSDWQATKAGYKARRAIPAPYLAPDASNFGANTTSFLIRSRSQGKLRSFRRYQAVEVTTTTKQQPDLACLSD